jgi:putative inorganic carbon (HCO3(-)) transporter
MAAEIGIVGLIAFLVVVFQIFRNSWKMIIFRGDRFLSSVLWGGLMGLVAFLFHSFFDTNFYAVQLSCLLWIMIGFVMSVGQLVKQS